jgi:hypothetical protein
MLAIFPAFPWIFLFERILPNSVAGWAAPVALNTFLLYMIGRMVEEK